MKTWIWAQFLSVKPYYRITSEFAMAKLFAGVLQRLHLLPANKWFSFALTP